MAVSNSYKEYIEEQLSNIDGLHYKSMFGGIGVYCDGVMFGLVSSKDGFFLRTDTTNASQFEDLGYSNFNPMKKGSGMPYHEVPVEVLEHRDTLTEWAGKSLEVAIRNKKK